MDTFNKALSFTFKNEGGFSDIPHDHGGATNFGIVRDDLARWRGHEVSADDVKNMQRSEAEAIYKKWYWDKLHLDRIQIDNVAIALFDRSVLNGLTGCSRHVRNVYNWHKDDAPNFDPLIVDINADDPERFIMRFADQCEAVHRTNVQHHPDQARFLYGWLNRVNRLRTELAGGEPNAIEQWIKDASGKA